MAHREGGTKTVDLKKGRKQPFPHSHPSTLRSRIPRVWLIPALLSLQGRFTFSSRRLLFTSPWFWKSLFHKALLVFTFSWSLQKAQHNRWLLRCRWPITKLNWWPGGDSCGNRNHRASIPWSHYDHDYLSIHCVFCITGWDIIRLVLKISLHLKDEKTKSRRN